MRKKGGEGFSLVEALMSLLVLSAGVIGAASMQLTALRNNQQSLFHSNALQLANDIADQIRGLAAANISDSDNPYLALDFTSGKHAAMPDELCFEAASSCDAIAWAEASIYDIQSRLKLLLPHGRIKVCRDATPWNESINNYSWDCHPDGGSASIVIKLGWREMREGIHGRAPSAASPQFVMPVKS